jgi:glycosyltransferase involved in cell wall biosynthesis
VRVLCVIDSLIYGGTERSLLELTPPLLERGVDLEVAYLYERPGLRDRFEATGVSLHALVGRDGRASRAARVRELIGTRKPDVVHTHLFEANVAGRIASGLSGVPVTSSLTGEPYGPEQLLDPRLRAWKVRAAQAADAATARFVTRFHAVSEHVADVMSRRLWIDRGRIEVIPRGRDAAALGSRTAERRDRARASLGLAREEQLVLAAGRHEHQKGLDVLIGSFPAVRAAVPSARLAIAGREGNQTLELREIAERSRLNGAVQLLGRRDDVPDLLCAADVFVLPSRWEGFPGALIEAMALGAPIVSADVPGAREALGDGDLGVFVAPGDGDALSDAIIGSLRDAETSAVRAKRATERFHERFTVDRAADRTVEFYERVARRTGRTRGNT